MMNMSIECEVKECKYHHQQEAYCTLNRIRVAEEKGQSGNHSDCASFEEKMK